MGVLDHFYPPGINLEKYRRGLPLNEVTDSPVNNFYYCIKITYHLIYAKINDFKFILGAI